MPAAQWQFGATAQAHRGRVRVQQRTAVTNLCESDHELGYQLTRRLLTTAITRLQAARIRILDLYAAPAPRVRGHAMTSSAMPAGYRIAARREETHDTVSLTLEPAGEPIADFRPGQFTMLYAFGVGEIPVSVSGPAGSPVLTQTIRAVGAVSTALCAAQAGQLVGVRGPFGTSWD